MKKIISLLFVSVLLSGTALASLEEIFPIIVTKQNQSQYNIAVNVSLPTDLEGAIVNNSKSRVVDLKVPKKINGRGLSSIHISVKQKDSSPYLSANIVFDDDFKDVNAYSTSFYINIEAINNVRLSVHYSDLDNFYLIDLNSYIDTKNQ